MPILNRVKGNKLVIITKLIPINPITISCDLPNNFDNNMKNEFDFSIKSNKFLAEHVIENKIRQILSKYNHGKDIHKHKN